jgi:hypothetical protein
MVKTVSEQKLRVAGIFVVVYKLRLALKVQSARQLIMPSIVKLLSSISAYTPPNSGAS